MRSGFTANVKNDVLKMIKFLKKLSFVVDFILSVPPLKYKVNTHNISGSAKLGSNPD